MSVFGSVQSRSFKKTGAPLDLKMGSGWAREQVARWEIPTRSWRRVGGGSILSARRRV